MSDKSNKHKFTYEHLKTLYAHEENVTRFAVAEHVV